MSKATVFIVIPNWNGADMLTKCLKSLLTQTKKHQIIVVENGSTDESATIVQRDFPNVILLEFSDNAGFAGGVNRGITYALEHGAEYIALFNNDAVADKDWLQALFSEAEKHSETGIITGKLLQTDKRHFDSTGDFYTTWGLPFPRGRNQLDKGQYNKSEEVFAASGGASLYRAALFRQIGLFDEDFFAYYEDVDISFRAQMTGWKVRYTPKAIAYHDAGSTSSAMGDFVRFHSAKNCLLLYARNMPTKLYWKYVLLFLLQFSGRAVKSILRRKFRVFLNGNWAAVKLHKKTVSIRKQHLAAQTVSTKYIDNILIHSRPPRNP